MDYVLLKTLVGEGLSTRQIATRLSTSQTNVRHHLKTAGLKTEPSWGAKPFLCIKCGESEPSKFYGHKRNYCGSCHNKDVIARGKLKRERALDYLGGACSECGYDRYKCALDVHHVDPSEKDPNFASMRGWSWERLQAELDKCRLLCKCCHSAVHSGALVLG